MEKISKERISELLEKYFEATATLQEEKMLRNYFQGDVDSEFLEYKPVFDFFSKEREMITGVKNSAKGRVERLSFRWMSVAVAASIAIIMFVSLPNKDDKLKLMISGVQIDDRELAIEKTDIQLIRLQHMLDKYRKSNNKLGSMERAGEAVFPLNDFNRVLKQNIVVNRLDD